MLFSLLLLYAHDMYSYKGFPPRATDAARYAHAGEIQQSVREAERRGPLFGATSDLIVPKLLVQS